MSKNMTTEKNVVRALLCGTVLFLALPVLAQSGGPYVLDWSTIDGGGGTSTAGQYLVRGTIGQHDAAYSQDHQYELLGGFWPGEPSCVVDFEHFALFAELWLVTGPDLPADLYEDNIVDELDLELFVDYWLWYCPYDWLLK
ncbi:MAG: hypothetical protein ACYS1A_10865 [Planctomycetota bacterium]|jgi:hypothetical protein